MKKNESFPLLRAESRCSEFSSHMISNQGGRDHLEYRSRLKLRLNCLTLPQSLLIVDDNDSNARILSSTLRIILGHTVQINHLRQLVLVREVLLAEPPDLIFLDDRLGHGISAEVSLKLIRSLNCHVRIIILSGLLTRARRIELQRLNVSDVVHKDDIDSTRISEAILKALNFPVS